MLIIATKCIVLELHTLSSVMPFLNFTYSSPGLMTLYIRRPRLDEERIGRGMPSSILYKRKKRHQFQIGVIKRCDPEQGITLCEINIIRSGNTDWHIINIYHYYRNLIRSTGSRQVERQGSPDRKRCGVSR